MTKRDDDHAQKSEPFWGRPLTLDFKGLFQTLGKATLHTSLLKWDELAGDALDAAAALGIEQTPQQQAGMLLNRSMRRAVFDLLRDYLKDFPDGDLSQKDLSQKADEIARQVEDELANYEVTLDEDFLNRPTEIAILPVFIERLQRWLESTGLEHHSPQSIAARLPSYFAYAMHCEFRNSGTKYEGVLRFIDTPVAEAWNRERTWQAYRLRFERQLDEPMFGEGFGLRDIYIPARGWYARRNESKDADDRESRDDVGRDQPGRIVERIVCDVKESLDAWMAGDTAENEKDRREDAIRILSGDPGAGKSSFARMYAQHRMSLGDHVLVVPLHLLNVKEDFADALERYSKLVDDCPTGLLDADHAESDLLLILDGLDELAKQGPTGANVAYSFVEAVTDTVQARNQVKLNLRVIISGRPIAVQNVREKFRKEGRILEFLPYHVPQEEREKKDQGYKYNDPLKLLAADLRQAWWKTFGVLKALDYSGLPEPLAGPQLDEITAQPLLNYLVALVYQRGKVDFSSDVTRNEIYSDLLDGVYARDWDSKEYPATEGISREEFRELLQEMALTAWHDRERVTTVKAVRERCQDNHLNQVLEKYEGRFSEGVSQLFTAFYFRKAEDVVGTEETFEFTHKSFGEYLTACRIVDALEEIHEEFEEAEKKRRRTAGGFSTTDALLAWLRECGPTAITTDLKVYLEHEVRLRSRKDRSDNQPVRADLWRESIARMIDAVLHSGMPCEQLSAEMNYAKTVELATNAESALLILHSCCAAALFDAPLGDSKPTKIDWPEATSFGSWIRRLVPQSPDHGSHIVLRSFSFLDLSDQLLGGGWLRGADLRGADLYRANLYRADLRGADLYRANLYRADLYRADLSEANLNGANLIEANLNRADLIGANLRAANLHGANLREANLREANLHGANLNRADLNRARITNSQLKSTRGTPRAKD